MNSPITAHMTVQPTPHMLLTIPEAAEELRVSEGFVKKEIREGRLRRRKIGRLTRIERGVLEAWIQRQPTEIVVNAWDLGESPAKPASDYVTEKTVGAR